MVANIDFDGEWAIEKKVKKLEKEIEDLEYRVVYGPLVAIAIMMHLLVAFIIIGRF